MMKKTSKPNALLIELVIVLLFFSLSAAVILQVFSAAHDRSMRGSVDSAAMLAAEDIAERFYASELNMSAFFIEDGWINTSGNGLIFTKEMEADGRKLSFMAQTDLAVQDQQVSAGKLDEWTLTVRDGDREVLSLPLARYVPGEGTP